MRILVTGAAGFLGTALSNQLAMIGHQVVGLDNYSSGKPDGLVPDVQIVEGDVSEKTLLWELLKNVDCVYHLAAKVIIQNSILYPRDYTDTNVGGTVTLLEAMRDVGNKKMVFISSGAIYGIQQQQPLTEGMKPHPASPYAVSKLSAEYYINTIGQLWGLESVCLRVFNAYGPRQSFSFTHAPVIPTFLRVCAAHGTIVVHGDGKKTRDFVYVDDVVDAAVSALSLVPSDEKVINVGSGIEHSVEDVLRFAQEITGVKPEVVYNQKRAGGPDRMRADLSLAQKKLNYQPKTLLEEGMRLTFERDARLHS